MNWAIPSIAIINQTLAFLNDTKNVDPIFIMRVGSRATQSDKYQQWTVTFNSAYSYIKPWWLNLLSFGIMKGSLQDERLNLNPGFCPYTPTV